MTTYETAIEYARTLGAEHGRNAAGWWEQDAIGGRAYPISAARETARQTLQGIEDGDPAVLDSLPAPDLSGQWADTLTGPQLVTAAMAAAGDPDERRQDWHGELFTAVCDAYELAFSTAVEDAVVTACKVVLS